MWYFQDVDGKSCQGAQDLTLINDAFPVHIILLKGLKIFLFFQQISLFSNFIVQFVEFSINLKITGLNESIEETNPIFCKYQANPPLA